MTLLSENGLESLDAVLKFVSNYMKGFSDFFLREISWQHLNHAPWLFK